MSSPLHDDVAKMYAHAKRHTIYAGNIIITFGHNRLEIQARLDGIDRAGELHQDAVAHDLDDPAIIAGQS